MLGACAQGDISPDEAAILMGAISVQARVVEVEELTQRPSVGVTTARPPLASARPTGVYVWVRSSTTSKVGLLSSAIGKTLVPRM